MEIFSPATDPLVRSAGRRAELQPRRHKILYRSLYLGILLAALGSAIAPSTAQESTPEIVPLEKKDRAPKKDLGPRALALLRMTPSGKATLVPVMIEINGKFYDASAYKADPVPMALDSGTVYEAEKTGVSQGLFTVNSALHSLAANTDVPWLATGVWLAAGAKPPNAPMKAEAVPRGIESSDEPPRLTRGETSNPPPSTPASAAPSPTSSGPATSGSSPAPSAPASTNPTASQPGTTPGEKKDDKTAGQRPSSPSEAAPPPIVQSTSSDDSYRPRLRRGKPTAPMPDYDVPGYGKPNASGSAGTTGASPGAKPAASAAMEPVELVPAISDADGPDLRSFTYEWDKGVEEERRKQMLDLAKAQLRAFIAERAKNQISATPAPRKTRTRTAPRSAKPAVEPIFENVQMHTFDLWGSNQPVLVLSADAHLPGAAVDLPSAPLQYKVLLVTRTDIYSNLHLLYSGITDRFHLDVIPQLDLIDAVDADGDGRGELLFHETTDVATGYVIYRAAADTLWKMFDSVNPE